MTRQTTPENTPGHAVYVGMQGDLHGTPAVRVYHVTSGPNLLPPIPYERLLSAAPDLLAASQMALGLLDHIVNLHGGLLQGTDCDTLLARRELTTAIRKATGQEE